MKHNDGKRMGDSAVAVAEQAREIPALIWARDFSDPHGESDAPEKFTDAPEYFTGRPEFRFDDSCKNREKQRKNGDSG